MKSVWVRLAVVAIVWIAVLGGVRFAFALPERCPTVSAASLRTAVTDAVAWYERTQHPDGSILFQYDEVTGTDLGGNDPVHHAGSVMALFQAANAGIPGAQPLAEKALGFAEAHLVSQDDWQTFSLGAPYDTGAAALLVIGLAYRRDLTGDTSKDELMRSLGRFLLAVTAADGSVSDQYDPTNGPYPTHSPFATGQAFYAFAVLHREFPGEGWDAHAQQVGTYLATRRDDAEDDMPDVSDHWAAYGLDVVAHWPSPPGTTRLTPAEVTYAERLAGVVGFQIRWESQRTGTTINKVLKGGDAVPAGLGTLGEATSALWRASLVDPRLAAISTPLHERAECAAGLTQVRQTTAEQAARFPQPADVEGAWFGSHGQMRIDDEQHSISSLLGGLTVVTGSRPTRTGATSDLPAIFAVLALFVMMNPCRAAFGVPGRERRRRMGLAAVGSGLAAAAAVAVAFAATPLLDALDINPPTARIAVGLVVAVSAAVDLFRRPPRPDPAFSGWWGAVVPVAIPVVFRPGLALLALSAAADHGVVPVVIGVALGAVGVTAAAAVPIEEGTLGRRLMRWGVGVLAVVMVLLAIALVVDGVFDV